MGATFLPEMLNTLTAPRWKIWCARLFGKCITGEDDVGQVVCYVWRGVTYMTDFKSTP